MQYRAVAATAGARALEQTAARAGRGFGRRAAAPAAHRSRQLLVLFTAAAATTTTAAATITTTTVTVGAGGRRRAVGRPARIAAEAAMRAQATRMLLLRDARAGTDATAFGDEWGHAKQIIIIEGFRQARRDVALGRYRIAHVVLLRVLLRRVLGVVPVLKAQLPRGCCRRVGR